MDRLGLGVVGLGEGRSIISAGVHSDLWEVVQLCGLDPQKSTATSRPGLWCGRAPAIQRLGGLPTKWHKPGFPPLPEHQRRVAVKVHIKHA